MKIESKLYTLGLNENEVKLYLMLLKVGEATGYQLAKQTKLTQPSVLFVLDKLRTKGLVLKSPRDNKHIYVAKDPRDFLEQKKKEVTDFETVIPEMLAMAHQMHTSAVKYFEGPEVLTKFLHAVASETKGVTMRCFLRCSPQGISDEAKHINEEFYSMLGEKKYKLQAVMPKQENICSFMKPYVETYDWHVRLVTPEEYAPSVATFIVKNYVCINSTLLRQSILIENKFIAEQQRQIFTMAWKYAGEESVLLPE